MSHAASTDAGKIEDVLDSVVQQLRSPDSTKVATACAALAMLVAHNPSIVQNLSAKVLPEVTRLLHVEHPLVQQNACAVIMTLAEQQAQEFNTSMQSYSEAGDWISSQLADTEAAADLRVNCAEALGAIASVSQSGADLLQQAGTQALIGALEDTSANLQEAAADAVCKMATSVQNRTSLVNKGALKGLASSLQLSNTEVQVRSLLALGMLVGDNPEWQIQLAKLDGALPRLLALRLQHDDEDSRAIADGIVATLLKNPACRQPLSDAFRAQHDRQQNTAQYV